MRTWTGGSSTPPELRDKMLAGAHGYLADLVDLVLRGCGYDFGDAAEAARLPPGTGSCLPSSPVTVRGSLVHLRP